MKRIFPFLIALLVFLPLTASAALPGFGQIVPEVCKSCPCGWGGVMAIIQNVVNFIIALSVVFATIIIAWAGGLYILSPTNPESRSTANKMLINAFIGLLIVLSAWLIVDFVMKTLYGGQFGPWNSILTAGGVGANSCVVAKETSPLFTGDIIAVPGQGTGAGTGGGGGSNCPAGDAASMVAFPAEATSGETERATGQTVQNFLGMRAAAKQAGIDLKVTDGYRSDAEQVELWNRYQSGRSGVAAKPCSLGGNGSNHNSGSALDITVGCSNGNSSCNTAAYRWLKANGATWNFRNAIASDPVHWSPSGH